MNITIEQLNTLSEIADELEKLTQASKLGMPPAFHIKQLQRALPELSQRIIAVVEAVGGENPWKEDR